MSEIGNMMNHLFVEVSQLVDASKTYQAAGGGGIFSPNPGLIVWTWLVFFLLLLVLYKFAWKPILRSLDERENKIRKSIEDASRIEKEVEEISKKNQEILDHAKLEAQKIVEDGRKQGERFREKIKMQAETEAQELAEKARLSINEAKREAILSIKKEAVHLSIEIASKLVQENLDNDKNRKLANQYLESIK